MRNLIALYLPIACAMFCIFLVGFLTDGSTTKTDLTSWMAVCVGAALFPLVIPVALIEKFLRASLPKPGKMLSRYPAYRNRTSG